MKKLLNNYRYITFITVLIIITLWFASTNLHWIDTRIFPTPQTTWRAFASIFSEGYKNHTLIEHLFSSMQRLFLAFALAAVTGIVLGLASGFSVGIRAALDPLMEFYRPLPPLAYYALLVLWMGIGNESKVALLYLACLAPIYIACASAVRGVSPLYLQGAATIGANKRQVFFHVILPSCLPEIFTGLRTAIGVGYTTVVSAEMVAATSGIGWMVLDASNYLRNDIVFVGIIVMSVTGIVIDQVLRFLERKIVPWKGHV